ncbi:MAG: sugar ABC transporter permease [Caldilinea sp. CFX5]|nr:sugar ABC transporter permease [Caldilinea sp. CFX5]
MRTTTISTTQRQAPVKSSGWLGNRRAWPQRRMTLTIVVPALIYYLLFRYYPVVQTLFLSTTDATLLAPTYQFIGLANFVRIFRDPDFTQIIWNTTYYAFATTLLTTALALLVAFVFEPVRRGVGLLRLLYYLPTVTSTIAIAAIWLWFYQPRFGLFNQLLSMVGIPALGWLKSPDWAMPGLIIMAIWGGVGFSALIFIAGLQGIPQDYIEAAKIDGATGVQITRFIKLPLLSRVILFVVVTGIIGSFQVFQQVYLMTRGGPLGTTQVLALEIYQQAFQHLKIGMAASLSFILFVIVSLLTVAQLRLQRSDWEL